MLSTLDRQIYYHLHRQTRIELARKYYKSGRKKNYHIVRKDLVKRLKSRTGATREQIFDSIERLRQFLLNKKE